MTIVEWIMSLLPYLNTGMLVLNIDLVLARFGFKITKREFKQKPLKNLFWALGIVLISSFISLMVQTYLSGYTPVAAFFILFLAYAIITQT